MSYCEICENWTEDGDPLCVDCKHISPYYDYEEDIIWFPEYYSNDDLYKDEREEI